MIRRPPVKAAANSTRPPLLPLTVLSGYSIAFFIGPNKVESSIHKNLACAHSPVLRAALNGPYIEAQNRSYTMSHIEPQVFDHLVRWAYTGNTSLRLQKEWYIDTVKKNKYKTCQQNIGEAIQLWILGEELLIRPLQDQIMKQLKACWEHHQVVLMEQVNYIYENTGEGSRLRQFIAMVGFRCCVVPEPEEPYSEDFVRDVRDFEELPESGEKKLKASAFLFHCEETAVPISILTRMRMAATMDETYQDLLT